MGTRWPILANIVPWVSILANVGAQGPIFCNMGPWALILANMGTQYGHQNPTVFKRLECVARFIRASPKPSDPADCPFLIGQLSNNRPIRKGQSAGRFGLARKNLATHSSRSNTVGFWFSSRTSSGPFGWIFDWKVREESWIFWPICCEVWKRSDAFFGEKIAPALEPFQNLYSSLPAFLYIWNSQRRTQTPSKSLKKPLLR